MCAVLLGASVSLHKVPAKRTMSCWWRTEGTTSAAGRRPRWGPLVPVRRNQSAVEPSGVLRGHWPLRKWPGRGCCPPASCPPPPTSGLRGGGHPQRAGLEGAGALSSRGWPGQCRGVGREPGCRRWGDRPACQHPAAETPRRGSRPPRAAKRAMRLLRRRTCGHLGSWAVSVTQKMSRRWPVGVCLRVTGRARRRGTPARHGPCLSAGPSLRCGSRRSHSMAGGRKGGRRDGDPKEVGVREAGVLVADVQGPAGGAPEASSYSCRTRLGQ